MRGAPSRCNFAVLSWRRAGYEHSVDSWIATGDAHVSAANENPNDGALAARASRTR
ncbi:MAG: hypothetical protein WKG01_36810 [Kofleriaceae bacterium]